MNHKDTFPSLRTTVTVMIQDCDIQNATNASSFVDADQKAPQGLLKFEDYPQAVLMTGFVTLIVFAIFGSVANFVSVLALTRSSKLSNATNLLLVSLCFCDLIFCSMNTPFAATIFWYGKWVYSELGCVASGVSRYFNVGASMFTIVAVAINRLIVIAYPRSQKLIFTPGNNLVFVASTWVLACLVIILPTGKFWGHFKWDPELGSCSVVPYNGRSCRHFLLTLMCVVPNITFVYCYSRIYFIVRRARRRLRSHSRLTSKSNTVSLSNVQLSEKEKMKTEKNGRLLRMILAVFFAFTFSYLPVNVVHVFGIFRDSSWVRVTCWITFFFSGCVNPIIYVCMSREYRKSYFELFRGSSGTSCVVEARTQTKTKIARL
ncbi:G-protein coupled receptor moody-like [Ornithodoros turicata]|uniref:G-protein coupled receptor moody-like n=1 Tax=Ornithodoros turicata TaxID=34597 RepID=UPI0031388A90